MLDFYFMMEGAEPVLYSASPLLTFHVRINTNKPFAIHSIALRCQIMLEVTQRHYSDQEKAQMKDLFGEPERWTQTLRTMLWTHSSMVVSPFSDTTLVDLPVPCSFDFNVAATKYFAGLKDGEVPLSLLFSGSVFYEGEGGGLQVLQIPWEKECKYRMPIDVWKRMMDIYYPNTNWLCIRRDVFEKLYEYKVKHGIPTWEQTLEAIIPA